jgi:polyphosphate kinase
MQRNLDLRVEALVLVEEPALVARIDAIVAAYLDPESRAFWLAPDGSWKCTGSADVQERLRALTPS